MHSSRISALLVTMVTVRYVSPTTGEINVCIHSNCQYIIAYPWLLYRSICVLLFVCCAYILYIYSCVMHSDSMHVHTQAGSHYSLHKELILYVYNTHTHTHTRLVHSTGVRPGYTRSRGGASSNTAQANSLCVGPRVL